MPYAITEPQRRQMHSNKILPPFPRASSASWGASHHITSNQRRQLPRHLVKVMMSMGHQHLYLHEGDITIIMAYVTELGFYVSYIDCHRVTLTDRKKVVKSADSNSKLTHAENERKRIWVRHSGSQRTLEPTGLDAETEDVRIALSEFQKTIFTIGFQPLKWRWRQVVKRT